MNIDLVSLFVGCNKKSSILSFCEKRFVVGCSSYICVYEMENDSFVYLTNRKGKIISLSIKDDLILYGTAEGYVCGFKEEKNEWIPFDVSLNKEKKAVCTVSLLKRNNEVYFSTAVYGKKVEIFKYKQEMPIQTLLLEEIVTCISFCLFEEEIFLFVATSKNSLDCYKKEKENFSLLKRLSGHLDLITSISFSYNKNSVSILTSSNDKTMHEWTLTGKYSFVLSSVLSGHKGAVTCSSWGKDSSFVVSCSFDRTIWIWRKKNGIWFPSTQLSNEKISYSTILFVFKEDEFVIGTGYSGSISLWKRKKECSEFIPYRCLSGHIESVESCSWFDNEKILSCSLDKTTRLWSSLDWKENNKTWMEKERPQTHGYEIKAICSISENSFISISDEKIARVFSSSKNIVEVPPLGLSNKETERKESVNYTSEEQIRKLTLWKENIKIYAHKNNFSCCCLSSDKKLFASSCESKNIETSEVKIWNVDDWCIVENIQPVHRLTIQEMCFSPNNKILLCVSRDRSFSLYFRKEKKTITIEGHSRSILCCSWLSENVFITGSRDKTSKIWKIEGFFVSEIRKLDFSFSVTSLAVSKNNLIVFGLENGSLYWLNSLDDCSIKEIYKKYTPCMLIRNMKWKENLLAICSEDCSLRILSFKSKIHD